MLERLLGGDPDKFKLTKFAPFDELENILENRTEPGAAYLNGEFRRFLKIYGVDYDLPAAYRPQSRLFDKVLLRRSAILISSSPVRARALVVETDSLFEKTQRGQPKPNDPDFADIMIWPMHIRRMKPSDKPHYLGIDEILRPDKADFYIRLTKIKNENSVGNFVQTYRGDFDYGYPYFRSTNENPFMLLANFAGLQ